MPRFYHPTVLNDRVLQTFLSIAAKLPEKARRRAIELAKSWEPLYQEENLMSDSPAP
jgi:hypothetical protein